MRQTKKKKVLSSRGRVRLLSLSLSLAKNDDHHKNLGVARMKHLEKSELVGGGESHNRGGTTRQPYLPTHKHEQTRTHTHDHTRCLTGFRGRKMMDATAVSRLASELEGLSSSSSSPSSSNHGRQSATVIVPSLHQFYEIGLLLFQVGSDYDDDDDIDDDDNNHERALRPQGADNDGDGSGPRNDVFAAFHRLVDAIPDHALRSTLSELCRATETLLVRQASEESDDLVLASRCLAGLFGGGTAASPRLRQVAYSKEWVSALAAMYDRLVLGGASQRQKGTVLSALSGLVLDGIFGQAATEGDVAATTTSTTAPSSATTTTTTISSSVEERVLEAIQAMEEESTDCLRDLQLWQKEHDGPDRRTLESCMEEAAAGSADDEGVALQQREYIYSMLESARRSPASAAQAAAAAAAVHPSSSHNNPTHALSDPKAAAKLPLAQTSAADELERRIQQVRSILPHLGEGFVETALSMYQGDVETTVSTLLNDPSQYPTALRILDPKLPRRKKERSAEEAAESAVARRLVKERVALQEREERERYVALLHVTAGEGGPGHDGGVGGEREDAGVASLFGGSGRNEYDDDYDDQYDEVDVKLGNIDSGFSDNNYTFEQVKMYNQIVREDEAEDSFWEGNRNLNRGNSTTAADRGPTSRRGANPRDDDDDDDDAPQYRGPDKIRGGRIVGPDGKIVRNPGGGKKPKGGNSNANPRSNNGNNNNGNIPNQSTSQNKGGRGGAAASSSNDVGSGKDKVAPNLQAGGGQTRPNKPRTKPKSDNRMNRQRDRKQTKQGTFGVQE